MNKQSNKQTNKKRNPKIQPTDLTPLLKYFLLEYMMWYYCKSSGETPTTGFWQLNSISYVEILIQLWACQAMPTNHHQLSRIFTIQRSLHITQGKTWMSLGLGCPFTKQNAQGLELHVRLSHLKTRKRNS